MGITNCVHPNCNAHLQRGRLVCGRHWFALSDELRAQCKKVSPAAPQALLIEIELFFRSRMIGGHEIVTCRGSTCDADVVWLPNSRRGKTCVEASSVTPEDQHVDHIKHTAHLPLCPNRLEFSRR